MTKLPARSEKAILMTALMAPKVVVVRLAKLVAGMRQLRFSLTEALESR